MKRLLLAASAAAMLLAGCATTGVPQQSSITPGTPYNLSSNEMQAVKTGVTNSLKDPTSAIFGSMQATKSGAGVVTVCGFVNGKNSFGGYVGSKPFVGALAGERNEAFVVVGMGGTDVETYATYSVCQKSGIYL